MYSNKLIACIKSKSGAILRESGDQVFLPYGSEYSIFLKNTAAEKAYIEILVDGTNPLEKSIIELPAGETTELRGWTAKFPENLFGNAFRFIEKTESIENYRGSKPEDSLVEVRFYFEDKSDWTSMFDKLKSDKRTDIYINCPHPRPVQPYYPGPYQTWCSVEGPNSNTSLKNHTTSIPSGGFNSAIMDQTRFGQNVDSTGITVRGKVEPNIISGSGTLSGKSFSKKFKHSIVFKLNGIVNNGEIVEAVTTKSKKICPSCGKTQKWSYTYCPHDGTFLESE